MIRPDGGSWSGVRDSFGERAAAVDAGGRPLELLRLSASFNSAHSALVDRVAQLDVDRPALARTFGIERDQESARLVLISEPVPGWRLAGLLRTAVEKSVVADLGAALFVMRRLLAIAESLQAETGVTQFFIGPERIVITPRARVVIVEPVLAAATGARSHASSDIAGIAVAGMSIMLGHPIDDAENIDPLSPVLQDAADVAAIRAGDRFSTALRLWFDRAIVADASLSFPDFKQARLALSRVLLQREPGCDASRRTLKVFLNDLAIETLVDSRAAALETSRLRGIQAKQRARWKAIAAPDEEWTLVEDEALGEGEVGVETAPVEEAPIEATPPVAATLLGQADARATLEEPLPRAAALEEEAIEVAASEGEAVEATGAQEPAIEAAPIEGAEALPAPPSTWFRSVAQHLGLASANPPPQTGVAAPPEDVVPEAAAPMSWTGPVAAEPARDFSAPPIEEEEPVEMVEEAFSEEAEPAARAGDPALSEDAHASWIRAISEQLGSARRAEEEAAVEAAPVGDETEAERGAALREERAEIVAPFPAEVAPLPEIESVVEDEPIAEDEPVAWIPPRDLVFKPEDLQPADTEVIEPPQAIPAPPPGSWVRSVAQRLGLVPAKAAPQTDIAAPPEDMVPDAAATTSWTEPVAAEPAPPREEAVEVVETSVETDFSAAPIEEEEPTEMVEEAFSEEAEPAPRAAEPALSGDAHTSWIRAISDQLGFARRAEEGAAAEVAPVGDETEAERGAALREERAEAERAEIVAPFPAEVAPLPEIESVVEDEPVAEDGPVAWIPPSDLVFKPEDLQPAETEVIEQPEAIPASSPPRSWARSMAQRLGLVPAEAAPQTDIAPPPEDMVPEAPSPASWTEPVWAEPAPPREEAAEVVEPPVQTDFSAAPIEEEEPVGTLEKAFSEEAEPAARAGEPALSEDAHASWIDAVSDQLGVARRAGEWAEAVAPRDQVSRPEGLRAPHAEERQPPTQPPPEAASPAAAATPLPAVPAGHKKVAPAKAADAERPRPAAQPATARPERRKIAVPAREWKRAAAVILIAGLSVSIVAGLVVAGRRYYARVTTPGTVAVASIPAGSQVLLDGTPRGMTPLTLTLSPGDHVLELRRNGVARRFPITMTPGAELSHKLDWATVKPTGTLVVGSTPAGARVIVDGKERGVTPLTIPDLPIGRRRVVIESTAGTVQREVTVVSDSQVTLNETIISGWIAAFAPFELQIFEGARLIGTTEGGRIMVPPGRHELAFVNTRLGFRETRAVEVNPGATTAVNIATVDGIVRINAAPGVEVLIDGVRVGETPVGDLRVPVGTHEIVLRQAQLGEQRVSVTVGASAPAEVTANFPGR